MADLCMPTSAAMSVSVTGRTPRWVARGVAAPRMAVSRMSLASALRARSNFGVATSPEYRNPVALLPKLCFTNCMTSKTIVITGTSSGFGQLSVRRFAEAGWNVVATVRKESDLDAHDGVANVNTLLLDVDDEEADLAFGELARSQFGRVDALINNAGYFQSGPLEASTMDQAHRQFQTNVFGLIALTK